MLAGLVPDSSTLVYTSSSRSEEGFSLSFWPPPHAICAESHLLLGALLTFVSFAHSFHSTLILFPLPIMIYFDCLRYHLCNTITSTLTSRSISLRTTHTRTHTISCLVGLEPCSEQLLAHYQNPIFVLQLTQRHWRVYKGIPKGAL